jgi:hypothetical protein
MPLIFLWQWYGLSDVPQLLKYAQLVCTKKLISLLGAGSLPHPAGLFHLGGSFQGPAQRFPAHW